MIVTCACKCYIACRVYHRHLAVGDRTLIRTKELNGLGLFLLVADRVPHGLLANKMSGKSVCRMSLELNLRYGTYHRPGLLASAVETADLLHVSSDHQQNSCTVP